MEQSKWNVILDKASSCRTAFLPKAPFRNVLSKCTYCKRNLMHYHYEDLTGCDAVWLTDEYRHSAGCLCPLHKLGGLKMETASTYQTARCHITQDHNLNIPSKQNLKFYKNEISLVSRSAFLFLHRRCVPCDSLCHLANPAWPLHSIRRIDLPTAIVMTDSKSARRTP